MSTFPILHIRSIEEGPGDRRGALSPSELAALGRRLDATAFATPSVGDLIGGRLPIRQLANGLFLTHDLRPEPLSRWLADIGARGYSSLLAATPDEFRDARLRRRDLPLLTGHGVVLASRGLSGEPLVGMEVSEVRRELRESRRQLKDLCGYPIRALVPEPTVTGRAFDGLVEREARDAGYALLLEPGDVSTLRHPRPREILRYRTREPGEGPDELFDWLLGRGFSRESAQFRRLTSAPRALLERLSRQT